MADILTLAAQYRAAIDRQDAAALKRIIDAYGGIYTRLLEKIELLSRDIVDLELTRGQVAQLARYKALISQIETELTRFQGYLGTEVGTVGRAAIKLGEANSLGLMNASAELAGLTAQFNRLPTAAIEKLLGFLDPQGPLFARIEKLAGTNAQGVANTILEMVGIGKNPRAIAAAIQDSLGGGLTDALRMTRTVQIYAYREANRANYVANSDVVTGWIWFAELDESTCPSCVAQHGTVHPLNEALNDHHNGRCTPLPQVGEGNNPVEQTGEAWFNSLSESEQRNLLGKGRYEAFSAGKFEFGALSGTRQDEVYGKMRVQTPLKDLI